MDLIIFLTLMAMGYLVGSSLEKKHYRSIEEREKLFLQLPAITTKTLPYADGQVRGLQLVNGSAVISVDYFKRILARLRNIFGGTITSYESLLDRARREAVLRMKEQAPEAAMIVNVRIETSAIGKYSARRNVSCLEALAYGTAVYLEKE